MEVAVSMLYNKTLAKHSTLDYKFRFCMQMLDCALKYRTALLCQIVRT